MTGVETPGEADWDAARERWRSAANRLWAAALTDAEGYRRLAEGVGDRLAELRRTTATPAELLAVEERPEAALVDAAACAVRADEIEAERARVRRAALVAAARDEGRTWVVLEEGFTRSVSMRLRPASPWWRSTSPTGTPSRRARGGGPRRGDRRGARRG